MDDISKYLNINSNSLSRRDATIDQLISNTDLSYKILNGLEITEKTIIQSKLDGSIIKNCKIQNADFSRSDLNAVRVENCLFSNVDFSLADIMSSVFSNCEFIDCNFKEAHISDCDFINSKFIKSSMTNCSFLKSVVRNSSFTETNFERSTMLLNKYHCTSFYNMSLGNCTFEYHIMRDCTFSSVTLNTDSLAYLYGCTLEQLKSANLMFLGKEVSEEYQINTKLIEELFQAFVEKHWYLGALFLKMNFRATSIYNSLNLIIDLIVKQNNYGFLLKADELLFIINILREQENNGELPLLVLENYIEKINSVLNNSLDKNKDVLSNLMNTAIQLKVIQEQKLLEQYSIFDDDLENSVELVFNKKPEIDPEKFFADISRCYSTEIKIIGYKDGSFIIKAICTTFAICKILELIKSLTGNVIEIYKNSVVLREMVTNPDYRKQLERTALSKAIEGAENSEFKMISIDSLVTFNNTIVNSSKAQVFSYLTELPDYGGYGNNNFYKIDIKYSAQPS
jgi:uncharacterized protein YjbI with pentapeptide repeats